MNNDFSFPKTDLADESDEIIKAHGFEPDGLVSDRTTVSGIDIFTMKVTNRTGEILSGKPIGEYTTINVGKVSIMTHEQFKSSVYVCANIFSKYISKATNTSSNSSILAAGLGNSAIGADAVGKRIIENLIVTRHIKQNKKELFDKLGLSDTSAILPGVLGTTGVEASDIIKGVINTTDPDIVIAIDALSSRRISRILSTVQISDSGISPGSGVGNSRKPISFETMQRPVIAIGIPTVANAEWVVSDVLTEMHCKKDLAFPKTLARELECYVTPKDTESELLAISKLCGYALNIAIHKNLRFEDIGDFL